MANSEATFKIPNDVIEPIVKEQVVAGVLAALGDPSKLITKVVERAIAQKVNREGKIDRCNFYNKYSMVEVLAEKAIHQVTMEAIAAWVEKNKPAIQAQVEKALSRKTSPFARALIDGLSQAVQQSWKFTCNINLEDKSR